MNVGLNCTEHTETVFVSCHLNRLTVTVENCVCECDATQPNESVTGDVVIYEAHGSIKGHAD